MDNIKIQLSDEQNLTAIIMPRLYARVFSPKTNILQECIRGALLENKMNKSLCKEMKKRKEFKRTMCQLCSYLKNCVDYEEYKNGHDDERRDMTKEPEA
jgi:hypothetical protein